MVAVAGVVGSAAPVGAVSAPTNPATILFVAGSVQSGGFTVHAIRADGKDERVVRRLPRSFDCCGLWSPRRDAIAFKDMQGRLLVMRLGDRRTRVLTGRATSFAWSPTGRRVAYMTRYDRPEIFTVGADGRDRRRIAGATRGTAARRDTPASGAAVYFFYGNLRWSPDGRMLAYIRDQDYESEPPPVAARVEVIRADGRGRARVFRFTPFVPQTLEWSPDSSTIAVGGYRDSGVRTVDIRTNRRFWVTDCCTDTFDIAWSPNGKKLALFSSGEFADPGAIVDADGSHFHAVAVEGKDPAWSRDSTMVAFGRGDEIDVIRADGQGRRTLAKTAADVHTGPTWK